MHRILIVEDDVTQLDLLKTTISEKYPDWVVKTAHNYASGKNLLDDSLLENEPFSLFLLDIQLSAEEGDRGGFFLAKEVRKHTAYFKVPILFLTAISDEGRFALSEFHCYNYITKPYTMADILLQLEQMLITGYLENTLELLDTNRILHRVHISDILTVESKSHTLTIYTQNNGNFVTRAYTLEKILLVLGSDFIQCHRRIIINKTHIRTYDKASKLIYLENRLIPVGRTFTKEIENYL